MKNLFTIFSLISLISATPKNPPDLEKSLKDLSIPLIGFHWQVYIHENFQEWAACHFCLKCPQVKFYTEYANQNQTEEIPNNSIESYSDPPEFYPCPDTLNVSTDSIMDELHLITDFKEKYYSEFTSITSAGHVRISNRFWTVPKNDEETGVEQEEKHFPQDFPDKMDITKRKLVVDGLDSEGLKNIELDFNYRYEIGSEKSWVELSSKDNKRYYSVTRGFFENGDRVKETSSRWDAKNRLSRYGLFMNIVQLDQATKLGCECIRDNFYTFDGVSSQLIKKCRKELKGYRKEIQVAAWLSNCWSKEEAKNYKKRFRVKNEL